MPRVVAEGTHRHPRIERDDSRNCQSTRSARIDSSRSATKISEQMPKETSD
jgi:hypothetical protein